MSIACQKYAHYSPLAKTDTSHYFANKIFLKYSHIHLLTYCLGLFSCYNGQIKFSLKPYEPQCLNILQKYLPIDQKSSKASVLCKALSDPDL